MRSNAAPTLGSRWRGYLLPCSRIRLAPYAEARHLARTPEAWSARSFFARAGAPPVASSPPLVSSGPPRLWHAANSALTRRRHATTGARPEVDRARLRREVHGPDSVESWLTEVEGLDVVYSSRATHRHPAAVRYPVSRPTERIRTSDLSEKGKHEGWGSRSVRSVSE